MSQVISSLPRGVEMSDFRRRIEQGLGGKLQEELEHKNREKSDALSRAQDYKISREQEAEHIRMADAHFSQFLMPIFLDVAAAKNIPLRNPFGGFIKLSDYGPNRTGFEKKVCRASMDFDSNTNVYVGGELYWDLKYKDKSTEYSYLQIGVTPSGLLVVDFGSLSGANLQQEGVMDNLYRSVEDLIVNHNGSQSTDIHDYSYSDPGAP